MNTKMLLGTVVGGIAAFLLGWLIFGIALMSYYESHQIAYEGMTKDSPNLPLLFIANLLYASILAVIMHWSKMTGLMKGAVIGAVISGLNTCSIDLYFYSLLNYFTDFTIVIVDVIVNIVFGAVVGAVIGWMMGMGKNEAAASS